MSLLRVLLTVLPDGILYLNDGIEWVPASVVISGRSLTVDRIRHPYLADPVDTLLFWLGMAWHCESFSVAIDKKDSCTLPRQGRRGAPTRALTHNWVGARACAPLCLLALFFVAILQNLLAIASFTQMICCFGRGMVNEALSLFFPCILC